MKRLRAGKLGTLSANGRLVPDAVAPAAPRGPGAAAARPQPTPTPDPDPEPDRPHGLDREHAHRQLNLRTFTNYLLSDWPAFPPATEGGPGSVVASNGAARIAADNPYDHRLEIVAAGREADGSVRIAHHAQIHYQLPAHSIDNRIVDPEVVIAPGGDDRAGARRRPRHLDGHRGRPARPVHRPARPRPRPDRRRPEVADGTRTWRDVPAVVSADGGEELGYGPGSAWGSWTITVPAEHTEPGPAAVTGTSSFALPYPNWVNYVKLVPPAGSVSHERRDHRGRPAACSRRPGLRHVRASPRTRTADLVGAIQYLKPAHAST